MTCEVGGGPPKSLQVEATQSSAVCLSPYKDSDGTLVPVMGDEEDVAPAEEDPIIRRMMKKARFADGVESGPAVAAGDRDDVDHRDDDGAVVFEDGFGEARDLRLPPGVPTPSKEMVRKHRASGHCPYRAWCTHCISGAANAPAHRARLSEPVGTVPELHSDYGFFRDKKGDRQNTVTVLVTKDRKSGGVSATVVPKKGVGGGYAVRQYIREVKKFGHHHKILIRSDGETAIKDLLSKVSALRASETLQAETVMETSPAGDSKANGRAERAVQSVEKQVRVLKGAVEEHLGKFSVRHACFPWLVLHSADVLTKFLVHPDGVTSYERIKGRPYSGTMYEFGQCVLYKVSAKVQGGVMEPRWAKGLWLGKRFSTEEHVVATAEGVVIRSGAVRPHPDVEYDSHLFDGLVGLPWDPSGKGTELSPEDVQDLPRVQVPRPEADMHPRVRRVMISKAYVERFGPTPGCNKCRAITSGDNSVPSLAHDPACRNRMEDLLAQDPDLAKVLDRARLREDEFLARRVEAGDTTARMSSSAVAPEPVPGGPLLRALRPLMPTWMAIQCGPTPEVQAR